MLAFEMLRVLMACVAGLGVGLIRQDHGDVQKGARSNLLASGSGDLDQSTLLECMCSTRETGEMQWS